MQFLITLQNTRELGFVLRVEKKGVSEWIGVLQAYLFAKEFCTSFAILTRLNAFEKGKRKLGPLRPTLDGVQGPNS